MRKNICVLVVALVGLFGFASLSGGKAKVVKQGGILSVSDIQGDPSAYKGTITITGVVAGKSRTDSKVFAVVDTSEAKTCKSTGCAKFYLPVSYEGARPEAWDEVNITGSFVKNIFVATKVDILRHLTF